MGIQWGIHVYVERFAIGGPCFMELGGSEARAQWRLKGQGNANAVFQYIGNDPELVRHLLVGVPATIFPVVTPLPQPFS